MISTADFKNGLTIALEGQPFQIVEFQHVKPGKGGAFVRTKLRNLTTGAVLDKTFRAGEKMEQAHVERRPMQFLYRSGEEYCFMDMDSYDQTSLTAEQVGEAAGFLKENQDVMISTWEGSLLGVELPSAVDLRVAATDPGLRGDTASGGTKPATMETGAVVQVPLFIQEGELIRVDTRTRQYVERVNR